MTTRMDLQDKPSLSPRVTILMPAFNGANFIGAAIKSILCQAYNNFELLIIDDASTDATCDIIEKNSDPRIKLFKNEKNIGVAGSLNRGLNLARGDYIARMDADDISLPDRLLKQVTFMDQNPEIGISGGFVQYFGSGISFVHKVPRKPEEIAAFIPFDTPLCHVTVIMRRSMIEEATLRYDTSFTQSEDYELWSRAIECFPMANLPDVFVKVRLHSASVTKNNQEEMCRQVTVIQQRLLKKLGVSAHSDDLKFHIRVGRGYRLHSLDEVRAAELWLNRLQAANKSTNVYDADAFACTIGRVWFICCANSTPVGLTLMKLWRSSKISSKYRPTAKEFSIFIASLLWHYLRIKFVSQVPNNQK